MSKNSYATAAIALAVVVPNLINPATALTDNRHGQTSATASFVAPVEIQVAAATKKATPTNARRQLKAELRRLTPAQKRKIGKARIGKINQLSGNELVAKGCFTHGVGCQGIPAFTKGVICCAIIKAGI